ncbi:MAG: GyrI-like domain-containing protein [Beijerinckiaceae bacterium]
MPGFRIQLPLAGLCALLLTAQAPVQAPGGVAPPAPVDSRPPPAQAQPPATAAPQQAQPTPTPQAAPSGPETATLAPGFTDPTGADEVMLAPKPAASLRGQAKWDDSIVKIQAALATIRSELAKAGIKAAGRPLTVFLSSDDEKFSYEAMVPVDPSTDMSKQLGSDVKLTQTPAGKAVRFGHKGPYDNIDETYEVLTAYLDAKGIEAKDAFIEEYLTETLPPADANTELHIYVQPK